MQSCRDHLLIDMFLTRISAPSLKKHSQVTGRTSYGRPISGDMCKADGDITRIEPVGEPLQGGLPKAPEKETEGCPKTELTGEMLCYERNK